MYGTYTSCVSVWKAFLLILNEHVLTYNIISHEHIDDRNRRYKLLLFVHRDIIIRNLTLARYPYYTYAPLSIINMSEPNCHTVRPPKYFILRMKY